MHIGITDTFTKLAPKIKEPINCLARQSQLMINSVDHVFSDKFVLSSTCHRTMCTLNSRSFQYLLVNILHYFRMVRRQNCGVYKIICHAKTSTSKLIVKMHSTQIMDDSRHLKCIMRNTIHVECRVRNVQTIWNHFNLPELAYTDDHLR